MLISYLISTWNRKDALKRHLDLLLKQTWPHWFEVIVCDDGSTDGTQEMLAGLKNTPKYTFQWFDTGNLDKACVAQSRNNGIRAVKGDVIIMADDDCLPHRQMIESFAQNFSPWEVQVGYRSNQEIYLDMVLPVPIEAEGNMAIWWQDWQAGKFSHFTTNCCCMATRAARIYAKDGSMGFDERFSGYGHEDTEFARRLHEAGYRMTFNPGAVVWHMNPSATSQQDFAWKEAEKVKSRTLLNQIVAEPYPVYPGYCNITGMMSEEELRWLYQTAQKMKSIVEIGCWRGRSTHALLSGCKGLVYAVDNWDPAFAGIEPIHHQAMKDARKYFFENVGHFRNLQVLEMVSLKAAEAFQDKSVEMVFIDADHSYESVMADIAAWLPKTIKMICGHDYNPMRHPGVVKAVDEVFGTSARYVDTIWYKEL